MLLFFFIIYKQEVWLVFSNLVDFDVSRETFLW